MRKPSRRNIILAIVVFAVVLVGGLLLSTNLPVIIAAALIGGLILLTAVDRNQEAHAISDRT